MEAQSQIEVQCHWCGAIMLRPGDLRCAVDPRGEGRGLCEFACPIVYRLAFVPSPEAGIESLSKEGARGISGKAPFELLESHVGAALSWDDLLDMHLALEITSIPQAELVS